MAATAVWALWTTAAEHVVSMARPTTDDNITVYDGAVFCDSERLERCVWTRQALPVLGMLGGRTQAMCQSAPVKQPSDSDHGTGPQREVQVCVAHAEHGSAPMC